MYCTETDYLRFLLEENKLGDIRTPFRQDYCRLLHCPSFRRLQGKTQLFPSIDSDFFRNRLTHSLEVAQISKTLGLLINELHLVPSKLDIINLDLLEFAGLAHDIGHPPFGHQGEEALDEEMKDSGGFEGNAQTLRILTRLEKKVLVDKEGDIENRKGLNLSFRSIASVLKYDKVIPYRLNDRLKHLKHNEEEADLIPFKGYYSSEEALVKEIQEKLLGDYNLEGESFKTIECQIMDIADDIAYSTYDLEDGLKGNFTSIYKVLFSDNVLEEVAKDIKPELFNKKEVSVNDVKDVLFDIFKSCFEFSPIKEYENLSDEIKFFTNVGISYNTSKIIANDGYFRTFTTSALINEFVNGIEFNYNEKIPMLSKVKLNTEIRRKVEVLKKVNYYSQILSPKLLISAFRGKRIVSEIFKILSETKNGHLMMPEDYSSIYMEFSKDKDYQKRIICDFIASMTDRYCINYYGRLTSKNPDSIFVPL